MEDDHFTGKTRDTRVEALPRNTFSSRQANRAVLREHVLDQKIKIGYPNDFVALPTPQMTWRR
ncbi:MAG TPA: hypothetical protein VHZ03_27965, partial [Trebonia sp.]|nr:hypothetical protein [Trebonia sp.]